MKIADSKIRQKVSNYIRSEKFQREFYKNKEIRKAKFNAIFWDDSDVESLVLELKRKLYEGAVYVTYRDKGEQTDNDWRANSRFRTTSPQHLLDHRITDVVRDPQNPRWIISCRVELYFSPQLVHADSLYKKGYPAGVDNIVRLMTNGWDYRRDQFGKTNYHQLYRGRVYGSWHGRYPVFARSRKSPNSRLFEKVAEFNNKYREDKIYAYLDSSYISVHGYYNGMPGLDDTIVKNIGTIRFGRR